MIKNTNTVARVVIDKDLNDYLKTITKIFNDELSKLNYSQKKTYGSYPLKKLSVSGLIHIAIGNLILQIDKRFDLKQSKEINHLKIFNFLSGAENE